MSATDSVSKKQNPSSPNSLGNVLVKLSDLHVLTLKELHTLRYTTVKEKEELANDIRTFLKDLIDDLESFDKMIVNIEQALDKEEKRAFRVLKNFKSVRKKFSLLLKKYQVLPITATSGEFIVGLHKVVNTEQTDKLPAGHIIRVEREGFFWKGDVLQPAEVVVAKRVST